MKYFDEIALYLSSPYEHPERYESRMKRPEEDEDDGE